MTTPAITEEGAKRVRAMCSVVEILDADLRRADVEWHKDRTNQFWARMTIRCMFALIEAMLWHSRQIAPEVAKAKGVILTANDMRVITEKRIKPDETTGVEIEVQAYLSFEDSVKKSMKVFAKVHKIPFTFDGNDPGYLALCGLNKKRDALMHPKDVFSIAVSEADRKEGFVAVEWFNGYIANLLKSA